MRCEIQEKVKVLKASRGSGDTKDYKEQIQSEKEKHSHL